MDDLKPLPCCQRAAESLGRAPSMGILCPSCQDYRSFMHYIRYPEDAEIYRPPAGFKHKTYKQTSEELGR